MNRLLLVLVLCAAPLLRGQTFYFPDGRKVSVPEARIVGDKIVVTLTLGDGATGEISQPIAKLARVDWPVPPAVAEAEAELKAGRALEALKKIDTVLPAQEAFREVPGSWWSQGAVVRAEALARLGKDVDAEVILERLRRAKAEPALIARTELAIVGALAGAGKREQARARLALLQAAATDDASLARIALITGRLALADGKAEDALLAYLRVPVLYPGEEDSLPAALLGSIQCYRALGETARAEAAAAALAERFPQSPEAAEARRLH
jgi:hypothetical protein